MVLDYPAFTLTDIEEEEEIEINPEIKQLEFADRYGKFAIEPLEPGFGMTLATHCAVYCMVRLRALR